MQRFIRFIEVFTFFAMVPFMPVTLYLMYVVMDRLGLIGL
jgi:hypothetical protein